MPYWDGGRILFEVIDGNAYVPCAISRMALEEISEKRCFGKADLLACFASGRERIEKLALAKLRARADGISGRLSLWADDVNILPPGGASIATGRQRSRYLVSSVSSKYPQVGDGLRSLRLKPSIDKPAGSDPWADQSFGFK